MKNIAILLLLASLSGCLGKAHEKTGLEGKPLPSFNLFLMDSTTYFNTNSIPTGKPIALFYFSPSCPYCRAQTEEIVEHMKKLKDINFYIFTTAPFTELKSFYDYYQLKKYPNVTVGLDYTSFFGNYFKAQGVPYMAIYNNNKRLKQVLVGKTEISVIKDIALE
ncbi:MAG TPA: thioredoxin fold domain-containing protein [Puia sp.]